LTTHLIGFGGRVFQQTVGIPIGTKTVFLRFVPFLHEADFIQGVLNRTEALASPVILFDVQAILVIPLH
jgi:hypothetical protein